VVENVEDYIWSSVATHCGSENFIDHLEKQINRQLRYHPQDRPKKG